MSASEQARGRRHPTAREFLWIAVMGTVVLVLAAATLPHVRAARDLRNCQANLKRIGEALRMYPQESEGERYPTTKWKDCLGNVQPWSGALDLKGVIPEYLEYADYFVCPVYPAGRTALEVWDAGKTTNPLWKAVEGFSHNGALEPCEVLGKPYYYYGWALSERTFELAITYLPRKPEDAVPKDVKDMGIPVITEFAPIHFDRFRTAIGTLADDLVSGRVALPADFWELHDPDGQAQELPMGSRISALRAGCERWYIYDIGNAAASAVEQSKIVLMHEEVFEREEQFQHGRGRLNVLYMDGHVACKVRELDSVWAGPFPLNESVYMLQDAVDGEL